MNGGVFDVHRTAAEQNQHVFKELDETDANEGAWILLREGVKRTCTFQQREFISNIWS